MNIFLVPKDLLLMADNMVASSSFTAQGFPAGAMIDVSTMSVAVSSSDVEHWTPAAITTALWLDAADSSTITLNGSTVSEWLDKSGNARHATQATATHQPTMSSGVLAFGGDDFLIVADNAGLQFGTGDFAVFAVVKVSNASKGADDQNTIISKNYPGFELYNYQGKLAGYLGGTSAAAAYPGLVSGEWVLAGQVRQSSSHTIRKNGYQSAVVTNTYSASNVGTEVWIGMRPGYYTSKHGLIGSQSEVIILGQGFSSETVQRIEGYLAHKWGLAGSLPSDHPYKTAAPMV